MSRIKVLGISLGSPKRDFSASVKLSGVTFEIERIGTGGDLAKAGSLLAHYDGKVDVFGLGGTNIVYRLGQRRYPIYEGKYLAGIPQHTPIVDGDFIKTFWEPQLLCNLLQRGDLEVKGKNVLITSALDRYSLASELRKNGAKLWVGDALLALKVPLLFPSLTMFEYAGYLTMPFLSRLPLKYLYPLGRNQEEKKTGLDRLFAPMQIIAGDFHLFNRYLPRSLAGKIVITSTLTGEDRQELHRRGVERVLSLGVTVGERSLGANLLEAMVVAVAQRKLFGTADKLRILEIISKGLTPGLQA